jgi:hypothetical protein
MKRSWFGIAFLLLALALPARASTFLAMSQEELVEQADAVVTGRVVEVISYWNREGTVILTEAVIEVDDAVLGDAPSHVRVRAFGGQVGDQKIVAFGHPTFERGEKLLLFLEPRQDGFRKVLGYQQGQFRIRTGPDGREIAVPAWDEESSRIVKADGTPVRAPRALALADLELQIRETARRVARPEAQ